MPPFRILGTGFAVSCLALAAAPVASADVNLTIVDGHITLIAKDATVRQILTEWARVGGTTVVNVDRLPGGPLTIELTDVPEQLALEVLLRSFSGFLAAPRAVPAANLSRFDRIVVMPTVAPPAPVAAPAARVPTAAQPAAQRFAPRTLDVPVDVAGRTGEPNPNPVPQAAQPPPQFVTPPSSFDSSGESQNVFSEDPVQREPSQPRPSFNRPRNAPSRPPSTARQDPTEPQPSSAPVVVQGSAVPGMKAPPLPVAPLAPGQTLSPVYVTPTQQAAPPSR